MEVCLGRGPEPLETVSLELLAMLLDVELVEGLELVPVGPEFLYDQ